MNAQFSDSLLVLAGAVDDWHDAQQLVATDPPKWQEDRGYFAYSRSLSDMLRRQVEALTRHRQFIDVQ